MENRSHVIIEETDQLKEVYNKVIAIRNTIDNNPILNQKCLRVFGSSVTHFPSEKAVSIQKDVSWHYQMKLDYLMSHLTVPRMFTHIKNTPMGLLLLNDDKNQSRPQMHEAFVRCLQESDPLMRTLLMCMPRDSAYFNGNMYSIPYRSFGKKNNIDQFIEETGPGGEELALSISFRTFLLTSVEDNTSISEFVTKANIDLATEDILSKESSDKILQMLRSDTEVLDGGYKMRYVSEKFIIPLLESGLKIRVIPFMLIILDIYYNPTKCANIVVDDMGSGSKDHEPSDFIRVCGWEQSLFSWIAKEKAPNSRYLKELEQPCMTDNFHEGLALFCAFGIDLSEKEIRSLAPVFTVGESDISNRKFLMYPKFLRSTNIPLFGVYAKIVDSFSSMKTKDRRDPMPLPEEYSKYKLGEIELDVHEILEASRANCKDIRAVGNAVLAKAVGPRPGSCRESETHDLLELATNVATVCGLTASRGVVHDRDMYAVYKCPNDKLELFVDLSEEGRRALEPLFSDLIQNAITVSGSMVGGLDNNEFLSVRVLDVPFIDSITIDPSLFGIIGGKEDIDLKDIHERITGPEDPELYNKYKFLVEFGGSVDSFASIIPNHVLAELKIGNDILEDIWRSDPVLAGKLPDTIEFNSTPDPTTPVPNNQDDSEPTAGALPKSTVDFLDVVLPGIKISETEKKLESSGVITIPPTPATKTKEEKGAEFIKIITKYLNHPHLDVYNSNAKTMFTQAATSLCKKGVGPNSDDYNNFRQMLQNWILIMKNQVIVNAAKRVGIELDKTMLYSIQTSRFMQKEFNKTYNRIFAIINDENSENDSLVKEIRLKLQRNTDKTTEEKEEIESALTRPNNMSLADWRYNLSKWKSHLCGNGDPPTTSPTPIPNNCRYENIYLLTPFMSPFRKFIHKMMFVSTEYTEGPRDIQNKISYLLDYFKHMPQFNFKKCGQNLVNIGNYPNTNLNSLNNAVFLGGVADIPEVFFSPAVNNETVDEHLKSLKNWYAISYIEQQNRQKCMDIFKNYTNLANPEQNDAKLDLLRHLKNIDPYMRIIYQFFDSWSSQGNVDFHQGDDKISRAINDHIVGDMVDFYNNTNDDIDAIDDILNNPPADMSTELDRLTVYKDFLKNVFNQLQGNIQFFEAYLTFFNGRLREIQVSNYNKSKIAWSACAAGGGGDAYPAVGGAIARGPGMMELLIQFMLLSKYAPVLIDIGSPRGSARNGNAAGGAADEVIARTIVNPISGPNTGSGIFDNTIDNRAKMQDYFRTKDAIEPRKRAVELQNIVNKIDTIQKFLDEFLAADKAINNPDNLKGASITGENGMLLTNLYNSVENLKLSINSIHNTIIHNQVWQFVPILNNQPPLANRHDQVPVAVFRYSTLFDNTGVKNNILSMMYNRKYNDNDTDTRADTNAGRPNSTTKSINNMLNELNPYIMSLNRNLYIVQTTPILAQGQNLPAGSVPKFKVCELQITYREECNNLECTIRLPLHSVFAAVASLEYLCDDNPEVRELKQMWYDAKFTIHEEERLKDILPFENSNRICYNYDNLIKINDKLLLILNRARQVDLEFLASTIKKDHRWLRAILQWDKKDIPKLMPALAHFGCHDDMTKSDMAIDTGESIAVAGKSPPLTEQHGGLLRMILLAHFFHNTKSLPNLQKNKIKNSELAAIYTQAKLKKKADKIAVDISNAVDVAFGPQQVPLPNYQIIITAIDTFYRGAAATSNQKDQMDDFKRLLIVLQKCQNSPNSYDVYNKCILDIENMYNDAKNNTCMNRGTC